MDNKYPKTLLPKTTTADPVLPPKPTNATSLTTTPTSPTHQSQEKPSVWPVLSPTSQKEMQIRLQSETAKLGLRQGTKPTSQQVEYLFNQLLSEFHQQEQQVQAKIE